MHRRLISSFSSGFTRIFAVVVMFSAFVLLWLTSIDIQVERDNYFHSYALNLRKAWNPSPPRWTPIRNKSEYVGEMANTTLTFLKLDSPEAQELIDMNVDCNQPWITIGVTGQLGATVMQTFFAYNLRLKYKVQVGMVTRAWEMVHEVFPDIHLQLLPPECLKQIENEYKRKTELISYKEALRQLAMGNGQHFLVQPTHHAVSTYWYLRKVLIEEFRIADHIATEAKGILGNLLDKWRQQMSDNQPHLTQPTTVVGVHARRQDDKALTYQKIFNSTLPPAAYYNLAFAAARKMFGAVAFVVITDNLKWAHQYLLTAHQDAVMQDKIISRGVDMAIMSMCDHLIVSVGSFGFLGGFLAGGKIFYPDGIYTGGEKPDLVQTEAEVRTYHHLIPIQYNHTEEFW